MQCAIDNELVEVTGFSLREWFLGSYFERKEKKKILLLFKQIEI